jgi:hypothetical protein
MELNFIQTLNDENGDTQPIIICLNLDDNPPLSLVCYEKKKKQIKIPKRVFVCLLVMCVLKPSVWFDNWKGYESEIEYVLDCALPSHTALTLLQYFYDKNVVFLWKNGFLVRDNVCDIFLSFTSHEGLRIEQIY